MKKVFGFLSVLVMLVSGFAPVTTALADDAEVLPVASPVVEVEPVDDDANPGPEEIDEEAEPVGTPESRSTTSARSMAATSTVPANDALGLDFVEFSNYDGILWLDFYRINDLEHPASGTIVEVSFDPTLISLTAPSGSLKTWYEEVDAEGVWRDFEISAATVNVDNDAGVITFTFDYDSSMPGDYERYYWIDFGYTTKQACDPEGGEYIVESEVVTFTSSTGESLDALTPEWVCNYEAVTGPAEEVLEFDWASFRDSGTLYLGFNRADEDVNPAPGSTVQVFYDPSLVNLAEGEYQLLAEFDGRDKSGNWHNGELVVGTVDVNSVTGAITFTFNENTTLDGWYGWNYWVDIDYTSVEICDPSAGSYVTDEVEVGFSASTGQDREARLPSMACNAASSTKAGSWIVEGERAEWTIDGGEHPGSGQVIDDAPYGMEFDCDSLVVTPHPGADTNTRVDCEADQVKVDFWDESSGIAGVTISVESTVIDGLEQTSNVNCADIRSLVSHDSAEARSLSGSSPTLPTAQQACYELFPPEGGDFLSKTVSVETALVGDAITYTIVGTTTSDQWDTITVTDEIPAEIAIDSITCTVEPAGYMSEPCHDLVENTLTVVAMANDGTPPGPVTITIVIEGTVIAEAGSEIVNEACYERGLPPVDDVDDVDDKDDKHDKGWGGYSLVQPLAVVGDPTIPGGGEICEAVVTLVVEPEPTPSTPVDPTETPDPTVEPTTPVEPTSEPIETPDPATPGASPSVPADPDPTVTGLPATGTSGASATGVALMFGAVAGVLLLVGAVGMYLRPRS